MTTQEAIENADRIRRILRFRVESSGTLDYASNVGMLDALEVIIRAAEENEARKLAERLYNADSCEGCPVSQYCTDFITAPCSPEHFYHNQHYLIEAAKKEGTT